MIRLCLWTVALAVLAAPARAQISLTVGAVQVSHDDRLERFDRTYSAYYAARLDGDTDLLPESNLAPSLGVSWRSRPTGLRFGLGYEISRATSDAEARFENDSGNRVSTALLDQVISMDVLVPVVPRVSIGAVASGAFRQLTVTARSIYADGSESLGGEYRINGVYEDTDPFFEFGALAEVALVPRVAATVRYTVPVGAPGGDLGIPLRDDDLQQGNNSFPRDFDRWLADAPGLDDGAAIRASHFQGPRLQVGLSIRPF